MKTKVKIVMADSDESLLEQYKQEFAQSVDFEVVATAQDGEAAVEALRVHQPDVLILDLMLSKVDGMGVVKIASAMEKRPLIVLLSAFVTGYVPAMAAGLGADYLTQP